MSTVPPAYAWDWFARQRLLWRNAQIRLAGATAPVSVRYAQVVDKQDVLPALREDYPDDAIVQDVVKAVIAEFVFLGQVDGHFEELGARNAPRGMRWWWTAITGREAQAPSRPPPPARQLALEDVLQGWGD